MGPEESGNQLDSGRIKHLFANHFLYLTFAGNKFFTKKNLILRKRYNLTTYDHFRQRPSDKGK